MSAKKVTDTVKKAAPEKTSEPVKAAENTVKEKAAAPVKEEAAKSAVVKAEPIKEEKVPEKKAEAKEVKAPVKKAEVKEEKAPAKKAVAPKKAAAPKTAAKTAKTAKPAKETVSQNVYVQFAGKEVKTEELVEQVKAIWTAEGHRASAIKSLEIYVKPDDMAAYYVINGKATGKIEL